MERVSKSGNRPLVTNGLGQLNLEFFVEFRQRSGKAAKAGATAAGPPKSRGGRREEVGKYGQKSLAGDACMYGIWRGAWLGGVLSRTRLSRQ